VASCLHLKKPKTVRKDAKDGGSNLVSEAFNIRGTESRLFVVSETVGMMDVPLICISSFVTQVSLYEQNILLSMILNDDGKVRILCSLFDPVDKLQKVNVLARPLTESIAMRIKKADQLVQMMQTRFDSILLAM
jgi:hypothetical protein